MTRGDRNLPGTMVLETSWDCGEGWLVVRECLVMGPWQHDHPDGSTHIRPPTGYDAEHMLLRTVRCVDGQAQLTLDCVPAFDYGRQHAKWRHTERGYTQAVVEPEGLDLTLTLTSDIRLGLEESSARGRTLLKEGDTRFCALSWGRRIPESYQDAYRRLVWTAHHWQHWLSHGRFPDHRWRGHLARSALTLKGLTFAPTGAIAAAATTSLPETPGGERNWDYRYTWMRDATFALWGLYTLGFEWEANDYVAFLRDLVERDRGDLQIVYGIDGRRELDEHFTSSKMMCWVAVDRGARLAILREDKDLVRTWRKAADEIHADICANALDDRSVFCQHYETTALDASLLLMPLLRFLPPDDPRIRATVLAIADELTQDGLVLRYQVDETDDGLSGDEGTFTICSFWLVSALSEIGEHQRARDICEKVLSYASPLLLYGEEIDPCSGRQLGNFPQAFTHLALINAVMHVIRKEQAAHRRAMAREVPEGKE